MNRKRRERRRKEQAARRAQTAPLQPGTATELDARRAQLDLKAENRVLRAQIKQLDPLDWPPRYRATVERVTATLLELEEMADPRTGRVLGPPGRSTTSTSLRDEGASTRAARRTMDRIVRDVNGIIDGTFILSHVEKRCRRSPNQCPMSGRVQRPLQADHVLRFCAGCGHPFPSTDSGYSE